MTLSDLQTRLLNVGLHIHRWKALRAWMRDRWSPQLEEVHWYQMPLAEALSLKGLLTVVRWNLREFQADEISANYDIVNLYSAPPPGDGSEHPAPTVWHARGLREKPWWDEPSSTKESLEQGAAEITDEFLQLREQLGAHPDDNSLTEGGKWKGAFLYRHKGKKDERICELCPKTSAVLDTLPLCKNFGFVMFSDLQPGTVIEPHTGSSNLRLRHHLGLDVPDHPHCFLSVAGEQRRWEEKKAFAFDDSYIHHVEHQAEQTRAVLVVDVWHPDLNEKDRETLSHPLFTQFGKGLSGREWEARLDHTLVRPLRLLRRHWRFRRAFVSEQGKEEVRAVLRRLFEVGDQYLREIEVPYFLDYGTLLGYHREGDVIRGDNDIDFGVFSEDFHKIWGERDLLPEGFTLHDTSYRHGCPKFYLSHQGWELDLYCYEDRGSTLAWPTESGYPCEREPVAKDIVLPLQPAQFLGTETWVPHKVDEYLTHRFHYTGLGAVRDKKTGYFRPG